MKDGLVVGIIATVIAVGVILLSINVGVNAAKDVMLKDCEVFGKARINSVVLTCGKP